MCPTDRWDGTKIVTMYMMLTFIDFIYLYLMELIYIPCSVTTHPLLTHGSKSIQDYKKPTIYGLAYSPSPLCPKNACFIYKNQIL